MNRMKAFLHCTYTVQNTSKQWQNLKKKYHPCLKFYLFIYFCQGFQFSKQGLIQGPWQWKHGVLTNGLPGNSPQLISSKTTVSQEYCLILPTGANFHFKKWAQEYHSCIWYCRNEKNLFSLWTAEFCASRNA